MHSSSDSKRITVKNRVSFLIRLMLVRPQAIVLRRGLTWGNGVRLASGFLLLCCTSARAQETVVFTGAGTELQSTLVGAIVSANKTSVTFANQYAGQVTIPWTDVKTISVRNRTILPNKSCTANCPPASVPFTGTITVGPGPSLNFPAPYPVPTVQTADIDAIKSPASTGCPGGKGGQSGLLNFSLGATLLSATQGQQTYNGAADVVKNWAPDKCGWPHQRTLVTITPSYDAKESSKPPPIITRDYDSSFQHLVFLKNNRAWAAVNIDLYHNNSLGIYFQQSYGAGAGVLLGPATRRLELGADIRFIGEHFYSPGKSVGIVGARLKETCTIPLRFIRSGATLTEAFRYIPAFNESRAWMLRGRVDLNIPITKKWAFTATPVDDDYVRNAPSTFRRNYFKTVISLGFSPSGK